MLAKKKNVCKNEGMRWWGAQPDPLGGSASTNATLRTEVAASLRGGAEATEGFVKNPLGAAAFSTP
jgi:hypothetical protein